MCKFAFDQIAIISNSYHLLTNNTVMMKTKKLFYILLSILVFSFASCTDDDKIDYIKQDDLPEVVQSFLSEYLPNNKFISAYLDDYGAHYFVQLEKDIEVMLTSDGEWISLESEKRLPESVKTLLSQNSRIRINEKHTKITKLFKYNEEIEITLGNNKVFFDMYAYEGDVLAEKLQGEAMGALPEKMKIFMREIIGMHTRSSDEEPWEHVVKFYGFSNRDSLYRLKIFPQVYVDFNDDGEWFTIRMPKKASSITNSLLKAISNEMQSVLQTKNPDSFRTLKKITRFISDKLYVFDIEQKDFVIINSDNKIVEPPLIKAKEYINKGFNPENELRYEVKTNTVPWNPFRFFFKAKGSDWDIFLMTDVDGNMIEVSAGPHNTDETKTVALPRATLEMLPTAITTYLDANYTDPKIIYITYDPYREGFSPEMYLYMSIPNNIIVLIFDSVTGQFLRDYKFNP